MSRENENIPVVILCGGESLRFRNSDHDYHKTLAPIGGKPILLHIIDRFRMFGMSEFIVCVRNSDTEIHEFFKNEAVNSEGIRLIRTGENTPTGGRLKSLENLINEPEFYLTYGDCLNDVNPLSLIELHSRRETICTITAVNPKSPCGIIDFGNDGLVYRFREKPQLDHWVNAGLFVFNQDIFQYLNEHSTLESDGLNALIEKNQLSVFKHTGFWQSMDSPKEYQLLINLWETDNAPWLKFNSDK